MTNTNISFRGNKEEWTSFIKDIKKDKKKVGDVISELIMSYKSNTITQKCHTNPISNDKQLQFSKGAIMEMIRNDIIKLIKGYSLDGDEVKSICQEEIDKVRRG